MAARRKKPRGKLSSPRSGLASSKTFRLEKDSLGEVKVPASSYHGPFTARALEVYRITGRPSHPAIIRAYAMIKRSAALANQRLKVLSGRKARAIVRASDELFAGVLDEHVVIDAINSGAGTALHMNINEVIANRALEILGKKRGEYQFLHPNDDVNRSQSSNDTFPTALHVALLTRLRGLFPALDQLARSLARKAKEFTAIRKVGRTHLMDAIPLSLGMEFAAYAAAVRDARDSIEVTSRGLRAVPLGGTAVGTGTNAPRGYRQLAVRNLAGVSRLPLKPQGDSRYGLQSRFAVARVSSSLRDLAGELTRIANDLRLLGSGPTAGMAELILPAVHAGSSIMPGKVNPSLAEALNMVCFRILGNDLTVALAVQAGQLELNVMLPVMAHCALESIDMLTSFLPIFSARAIDGLKANERHLALAVARSPSLVTLLAPSIGYVKAARLYQTAVEEGISVRELALREKILGARELDAALGKR